MTLDGSQSHTGYIHENRNLREFKCHGVANNRHDQSERGARRLSDNFSHPVQGILLVHYRHC